MSYQPQPVATENVVFPSELLKLTEMMAKNAHEVWPATRMEQGWSYGEERNDARKKHPCLVAYEDLPEAEKQYDRSMAMETLKLIVKMGFDIVPRLGNEG